MCPAWKSVVVQKQTNPAQPPATTVFWLKAPWGNWERTWAQDSDRVTESPTSQLSGDKTSNWKLLQSQTTPLASSTPTPPLRQSMGQMAPALEGAEERAAEHGWSARAKPRRARPPSRWQKQRRNPGTERRKSQGHQATNPARTIGCKRRRLKFRDKEVVAWVRSSRQKGSALQSLPPTRALGPSGYC